MKKQSSYQRLKAENAKLKSDLRELAARPTSERSLMIKMTEVYQYKFEEMVWHGNPTTEVRIFGALLNKIQ